MAVNTGRIDIYRLIKDHFLIDQIHEEDKYKLVIIAVRGTYTDILFALMFDFKLKASRIILMLAGNIYGGWFVHREFISPYNQVVINELLDSLMTSPENHPENELDSVIRNIITHNLDHYLRTLCLRGLITDKYLSLIISGDHDRLFATIFELCFHEDIDITISALAKHEFPQRITAEFFKLDFECTLPRITSIILNGDNKLWVNCKKNLRLP